MADAARQGKARRGEAKVGGGGGGGNRLFAYPAIHLRLEVGSVGTEPRKVILKRCIIPVNETERASLRHAARQVRSNARESVKDPQRNACVCVCVCVSNRVKARSVDRQDPAFRYF